MRVLCIHIRRFLPVIKRDVFDLRQKLEIRLSELGDGVPEDLAMKTQIVWGDTRSYCDMINNSILGRYDQRLQLSNL